MTKQTGGSNRNGRRGDPNQDLPWLGWIAALLVVVIVVVAVAMGMERTSNQRNGPAEVRMTPLVGGMAVAVATEVATPGDTEVAEVTPLPANVAETAAISGSVEITSTEVLTDTDTFTLTGEMTPTESLTSTVEITGTEEMSSEVVATAEVTATDDALATVVATETVSPTTEVTAEATAMPTPRPTVRPSATTRPTATPTVDMQVFEPGDIVQASQGRVEIHADASSDSMVLDSYGPVVALEVVDPSGDYSGYPVEADGHGWVRVRATDGLVGWVMTDQVEAQ